MKIAVVGFAAEGKVSYDYYTNLGHEVTICDINSQLDFPEGAKTQTGDNYLDNLDSFDLILRSAGIKPSTILEKNPSVAEKITTQVSEFIGNCPTKNIIGVTGTKGKGTTSSLIAKMLEASGKNVHLGGNIGIPVLGFIDKVGPDDWVVLELSSFQLIDCKHSPHIAVCLMVVPEHLDWHEDFEEYIAAKQQLFINQVEGDVAIYNFNDENSESVADATMGTQIPYMQKPGAYVRYESEIVIEDKVICKVDEIKLLGKHNWQNVCAAITAAWQATKDVKSIRGAVTSFEGLEHRLEFVRELDGVKYYEDSFGTTPETAIVAIESFSEPKVVILGGSEKSADFETLADAAASSDIRQIIIIGNTTHPTYKTASLKIESALNKRGVTNVTSLIKPGGASMEEIVQAARGAAQPGDVVILSAACASFDMFTDYKDRGNQFKQAVQELA